MTLEVTIGDVVSRAEGLCTAWGKTTIAVEMPPRVAGWQAGSARVMNAVDALPADDVRPFVVDVRRPPSFALISRQQPGQTPSSSYYLTRALAPIAPRAGRPETRITRIDPSQPDAEALATVDVIVLDHPGKMSALTIRQLAALLKRGIGVL